MDNKEKNFVSAVLYVYNNEKEISSVLKNINEVLKTNFEKYEIICVNDASNDRSLQEIKEFAKELDNEILQVINMGYYQGIELSMNAGVDLAIGDFVYEFDNLVQNYDDECIMRVYNKSLEGFDIVSATSKGKSNKFSSLFYKIFNKYSNLEYKLGTETFRILSRRAINRVDAVSKRVMYRKAAYADCGLKFYNLKYLPITKEKRKFNEETQRNRMETAVNSLILFTNVGYKFSLIMSFIMIALTILVTIYTVLTFVSRNPVQGWTTTMLFLAFGFFGLFTIMAIIIKYLEILLGLIFKKNKYIIGSIEKLH